MRPVIYTCQKCTYPEGMEFRPIMYILIVRMKSVGNHMAFLNINMYVKDELQNSSLDFEKTSVAQGIRCFPQNWLIIECI